MAGNPFNALLEASNNQASEIQRRYEQHRTGRNAQQAALLLDPEFPGMRLDAVLAQLLEAAGNDAERVDPRHCLVFWARPPAAVRALVAAVQDKLRTQAPHLWLTPADSLHMTTLEVAHSRTAAEIDELAAPLRLSAATERITDYPFDHRARLVKPMLGFDDAAVALTYLPAAGEAESSLPSSLPSSSSPSNARAVRDDSYTYHHLRRDVHDICVAAGVPVAQRYTAPSAHLTVARFVSAEDFVAAGNGRPDPQKLRKWLETLEEVNLWLRRTFWPREDGSIPAGGEWIVGQEKGLDCRRGTLWYGGGETLRLGRGF